MASRTDRTTTPAEYPVVERERRMIADMLVSRIPMLKRCDQDGLALFIKSDEAVGISLITVEMEGGYCLHLIFEESGVIKTWRWSDHSASWQLEQGEESLTSTDLFDRLSGIFG